MTVRVRRIIKQEIEVPGLGAAIKHARESSGRSLTSLAKAAGISRNYWYQLESEAVLGGIAEDTLRKVEEVLSVNFGVSFEDGAANND